MSRLGGRDMISPFSFFTTAFIAACAAVPAAILSEFLAVNRVRKLSKERQLDAREFIYPFWSRLKISLALGGGHKMFADKMLSRYIYIHRLAYFIVAFVLIGYGTVLAITYIL